MDRAYEDSETRSLVASLGMLPIVPPKSNRKKSWEYDKTPYKRRNEVERFFRRIRSYRRVFTCYDKLDIMYLTFVHLAIINELLWKIM